MPTSDEDLQKEAERVQRLREQVADAEAVRVSRERELSNDVTLLQLQAEAAQLETRLALAKQSGKVSTVKSGASAPLDAAKADLTRAVAAQKAATTTPSKAETGEQVPTSTPTEPSAPADGKTTKES